MSVNDATLMWLSGGARLKPRVQHPKVHLCEDVASPYWFIRYWDDELQPDGSIKTTRKRRILGPLKGPKGLTKHGAEVQRDKFLAGLNTAPTRCEAAVEAAKPVEVGSFIFGRLAEMWRQDYVDNEKVRLATPTRVKYRNRLDNHILPRWRDAKLSELDNTKSVLMWLQNDCNSWHMMIDLRNIMSGIITRAQEWGVIPRSFANPMQWVKVGKKWTVWEDRILTDEETVAVFAHMRDPQLLICETCIYTGTRISEALGLQLRHVDLGKGTIRIAQRHCRGDVDEPKTRDSRRILALGALTERYRAWIEKKGITRPEDWIFPQDNTLGPRKHCHGPMWDSSVRTMLKDAAKTAGCDFTGFGLHSFRRANITLRQEVGGSAIEAQKIAGHAHVSMTGEYTKVQLARQDELTRRIQDRIENARKEQEEKERRERQKADEEAVA